MSKKSVKILMAEIDRLLLETWMSRADELQAPVWQAATLYQ